ncbi:MAG: type III secretion system chaperone [Deltaproteobacteria bacterium]|jgi:hypothetical protein|nr:type III secretion system chaperone [Deltaproteobacteria bacterium]
MPTWNNPEESLAESAGRVLAAFAAEMDMTPENLALEDGYTCLAINKVSVLHIRLAEKEAGLDLFMELGTLPAGPGRLGLCEDMLQGNVLFQGTGGPALGLDRERGIATLTLRVSLPCLTVRHFRNSLEVFLDAVEFWRERLVGTAEDGVDAAPDAFLLRV